MSEFSQQFQPYGFEYYTAGTQPSEIGVVPAQRNRLRAWSERGDPEWLGRWEVRLHDFSLQGLNHPEGLFSQCSNGYALATLMADKPGELTKVPVKQADVNPVPTGDIVGLHHAYVFDTLIVGAGSGANVSLWKQTSTTDPTPSAITYSPAASICSLSSVLDDGVARLAVGRIGAATQLHSDASATVATTMHTSTNSTWGIIMSGIGTTSGVPVMLIYAGTTIGRKSTDADLTTAISTEFTGVNAGGFAVGRIHPKGRAEKAVWAIPKVTTTAGALKYGAEVLMELWVTDMELSTMDKLELKYLPDGILQAVPWRDGVVATDGKRTVYWDGEKEYELGAFRAREGNELSATFPTQNGINSDTRRRVRGLLPRGPDLYQLVQTYDANVSLTSQMKLEQYVFETGAWHVASPTLITGAGDATLYAYLSANSMPFSPDTNITYLRDNSTITTQWAQAFIYPPGESALWQWSLSDGTVTTGIPELENTGLLLTPRWLLDGIELNPKVVTEVLFLGNLDSAVGQTFQVSVRGRNMAGTAYTTAYSKTFEQGKVVEDYRRSNAGGWVNIQDIQIRLNSSVGTGDTRDQPGLLPLVIRGFYSKDYRRITEKEVAGAI